MNSRLTPTHLKRGKGGAEAGGRHAGLRHPIDDKGIEQRLDDVGLDDRGEALEDELRDRRSSGVPSGDRGHGGRSGQDRKRH